MVVGSCSKYRTLWASRMKLADRRRRLDSSWIHSFWVVAVEFSGRNWGTALAIWGC